MKYLFLAAAMVATGVDAAVYNVPGDFPTPWAASQSTTLKPGDVVEITGTFTGNSAKIWPQVSGITYRGDGNTLLNLKGASVPAYTGGIYTANPGSTGYKAPGIKDIALENLKVTGGDYCVVGYGTKGSDASKNWRLDKVDISGCNVGFFFSGQFAKVTNSKFDRNRSGGGWIFGPQGGGPSYFEVRNSTFSNCKAVTPNGNCDGLNIQDAIFGFMEGLVIYGNYDGLDIGSQKSSPGSGFMIVRNVNSHDNSNTNFPSSTTITGPITYEFNKEANNCNWGSTVVYENSANVNFLNGDIENACFGINLSTASPNKGPFLVQNMRIAAKTPINGTATKVTNVLSPQGVLKPISAESKDLIDAGTFWTTTKLAVDGRVVSTTKDPRTYFWVGDEVQVGTARAKVTDLSSTAITVDRDITAPIGAGVGLPWCGSRPDIGSKEWCEQQPAPIDPPPPPPPVDPRPIDPPPPPPPVEPAPVVRPVAPTGFRVVP